MAEENSFLLSVAPMMDYTDRHCRYFHRLLAPNALLYTEMIVADALVRGGRTDLLEFSTEEHPVALQLGGCEPATLAAAARLAESAGFDEVNLNVGCPSDRVKSGRFGACLMAEPTLVADCVAAMKAATGLPVTVKSRIGIDDQDSFEFLHRFARAVADAGTARIIVHARKAWLTGLSPKQNREIPPLDYERVRRLKNATPALPVVVNGGIDNATLAIALAADFDGIMLGRRAYAEPMLLARLDAHFFGHGPLAEKEVLASYDDYVGLALRRGAQLRQLLRPVAGLFHGQPGGRRWRQALNELAGASWAPGSLTELAAAHRNVWRHCAGVTSRIGQSSPPLAATKTAAT